MYGHFVPVGQAHLGDLRRAEFGFFGVVVNAGANAAALRAVGEPMPARRSGSCRFPAKPRLAQRLVDRCHCRAQLAWAPFGEKPRQFLPQSGRPKKPPAPSDFGRAGHTGANAPVNAPTVPGKAPRPHLPDLDGASTIEKAAKRARRYFFVFIPSRSARRRVSRRRKPMAPSIRWPPSCRPSAAPPSGPCALRLGEPGVLAAAGWSPPVPAGIRRPDDDVSLRPGEVSRVPRHRGLRSARWWSPGTKPTEMNDAVASSPW